MFAELIGPAGNTILSRFPAQGPDHNRHRGGQLRRAVLQRDLAFEHVPERDGDPGSKRNLLKQLPRPCREIVPAASAEFCTWQAAVMSDPDLARR